MFVNGLLEGNTKRAIRVHQHHRWDVKIKLWENKIWEIIHLELF